MDLEKIDKSSSIIKYSKTDNFDKNVEKNIWKRN